MSASIFHGAPGSFKSASAFWFEVLPALRQGRLVVTNIEGVLTKESIEIELDETFPESADIWRLSSQTQTGLFLWRRWFWWMPVKAFIIIDEVQDVFPSDAKVFKPEDLDNQGIETIKEHLPEKYYERYKEEIATFKPDLSEGTSDDTGEIILDENGDILYPRLMREANMRHRKYNWDIIYCTPEISEIHKLVRSVCEFAYFHKYNQALEFIPYFKRRPRIHEHSPKSSGQPKKKDDVTKWRKVPLEVHKCYRSTSTGGITKRGGLNGFNDPSLIVAIALLFLSLSYSTWWLFIKEDSKPVIESGLVTNKEGKQVPSSSSSQNLNISGNTSNNKAISENDIPLALPYDASNIYMTGYQSVFNTNYGNVTEVKEFIFTLKLEDKEFSLNNYDLENFGILVRYFNDCRVELYNNKHSRIVSCMPKFTSTAKQESSQQQNVLNM